MGETPNASANQVKSNHGEWKEVLERQGEDGSPISAGSPLLTKYVTQRKTGVCRSYLPFDEKGSGEATWETGNLKETLYKASEVRSFRTRYFTSSPLKQYHAVVPRVDGYATKALIRLL